jgi:outer membrane immunogenic protein
MKRVLLASLAAIALASGSAFAADLPPAPPVYKAPAAVAPTYNWTGCYLGAGGGYGMYNSDATEIVASTGAVVLPEGTTGGRGWLGQVQGGCDYQFALGSLGNWVIGAFADYDWMDIHGTHNGLGGATGEMKENSAWAAGARIGYLVTPTFLVYQSGGYSQTHFDQINYTGGGTGIALPATRFNGWFLGTGFEYAFTFLPIHGLFLKSEYRFAQYQSKSPIDFFTATGAQTAVAETEKPYVQTFTTELVYRFNWQ